jgi:hypothetical protein
MTHLEEDIGFVDEHHCLPDTRNLQRIPEPALQGGCIHSEISGTLDVQRPLEKLSDGFGCQRLALR